MNITIPNLYANFFCNTISPLNISSSPTPERYGIFFVAYLCDGQKRISMQIQKRRSIYINGITSLVISLTLVFPMLLGMMGYDIFNRRSVPSPARVISFWEVARQFLLYFLMIFILMMINTIRHSKIAGWQKIVASVAVTVVFYFLFSLFRPSPHEHGQKPMMPGQSDPAVEQMKPPPPNDTAGDIPRMPDRFFGPDYRMITEFLFILIITTLLGKVFELVGDKQKMQLENEKLRSENLQNRYDVLLNQINPHFFFNSLNSLSSLVRDSRIDNALRYIDELSNTYRYAMQSSGRELVTVAEELESLNAYNYLLHIRFEDKLFIETNVDEQAMQMLLPVLSLQPLIENVVKHNIISTDAPLTITITGNRDCISVINPVRPRKVLTGRSGTGLNNLATRYRLLTGKDLIIAEEVDIFSVTLPLTKPDDL